MKAFAGNRILMLLENNPYPQDGRVRREANALADAGYKVMVISPKRPKQPSREVINNIHVYRYPAPAEGDGLIGYLWEYGYSMAAAFYLSILILFQQGFDVIHAHNPPDTFVFIAAFYKLFGKRFVLIIMIYHQKCTTPASTDKVADLSTLYWLC